MTRMEIPLGERDLKTALQIFNKLKAEDNDFGWIGDVKWEFSSYSHNDYTTLQIRVESWKMKREDLRAFEEYVESLDPVIDLDVHLSDDSPLIFTVKLPEEEAKGGSE